MILWTGTSGFQYEEWKGNFYPDDLPKSRMLEFYAGQFPTTEINYTFRSLPGEKTITRWRDNTPDDFRFALKSPQKITHFAKLRGCRESLVTFGHAIGGLADKQGPVLFQLPSSFKMELPLLREFLGMLPDGMRAAFEFRHESWLDDEIYDALKKANAALCIAESEDFKTPPVATADFGYLRLRTGVYEPADIREWAKFLRRQRGTWSEAFVYFKHEDTGSGPVFAKMLMKEMEA